MLSRANAAQAALYKDETHDSEEEPSGGSQLKNLFHRALPRGAIILGLLFAINAASGLVKQKVLGHQFGAGVELDAFYNALNLTQFPVNLLILGGVIGPFLPLFMGLKGEAESAARDFARTILTTALIAVGIAMAFVFVFAPQIAGFSGPGFQGPDRDMYVMLIRIVALGQIAITASLVLGEILVAEKRFLSYGLADLALYGGVSIFSLALGGVLGIYAAAIGFLVGALGHLGVRLIGIFRTSFRPRASLAFRTKGVGEFVLLMLPKMASMGLFSVLMLYFNQITSTLAPGSTSSWSIALEFQSTGESVVGLAFALAAFSALSAAAAAGDKRAFKRVLRTNIITIAFFSTCAAVAIMVLGSFVVGLLKGGAFDQTDVDRTTMVLFILALSIPFESLVELLARGIYATHNTLEPTLAVAAGFTVGIITTTMLGGPLGLAALPAGYVAFRLVHMAGLALFLRPRIARIGGTSRWSRAIVRDRWGEMPGATRKAMPAGQVLVLVLLLASLTAGTLFAGAQALSKTSLLGAPEITPWARVNGTRPPVVITDPTAGPTVSGPVPSASVAVQTGNFSMDLYQPGDFVSEILDTWCVPAAMQTSMNMMSLEADTTRDTQAKLFDLAVSLGGGAYGGADPVGWAKGLTSLGYGKYSVMSTSKMTDAVHLVAKQVRLTQRPGGLVVWKGWHSWVVSGFTATADPAVTDKFTVLSLRIEDVWYPRASRIWGQSRGPDADVPVDQLGKDYKVWNQAKIIASREGMYVFVVPEL